MTSSLNQNVLNSYTHNYTCKRIYTSFNLCFTTCKVIKLNTTLQKCLHVTIELQALQALHHHVHRLNLRRMTFSTSIKKANRNEVPI